MIKTLDRQATPQRRQTFEQSGKICCRRQVNKIVDLIKGNRAWNSFRWIRQRSVSISSMGRANERDQPAK